jgi:SHS2 domain-containing protein
MFEFFDHTADLGIHIETPRLEDVFVEAAQALFAVLVDDPVTIKSRESRRYQIPGDDRALLLFDWLRALLLAFETEGWLVGRSEVAIGDDGLTTTTWGEHYDPDRHLLGNEVKAITYHGLFVKRAGNGWEAEVIVDI